MNEKYGFEYAEFVEQKLRPHPVGRSLDALKSALPENASEEKLEAVIDQMDEKDRIKMIGENWRWNEY